MAPGENYVHVMDPHVTEQAAVSATVTIAEGETWQVDFPTLPGAALPAADADP